jgi:hypothetical protein
MYIQNLSVYIQVMYQLRMTRYTLIHADIRKLQVESTHRHLRMPSYADMPQHTLAHALIHRYALAHALVPRQKAEMQASRHQWEATRVVMATTAQEYQGVEVASTAQGDYGLQTQPASNATTLNTKP